MNEIMPNADHPVFVDFIVMFVSISFLFYCLSFISLRLKKVYHEWSDPFEMIGRWSLWFAALLTLASIKIGFYANHNFNHDEFSHLNMSHHRYWLVVTTGVLLLISLWSFFYYGKPKKINLTFLAVFLLLEILILATAWWSFINPQETDRDIITPQSAVTSSHPNNQ